MNVINTPTTLVVVIVWATSGRLAVLPLCECDKLLLHFMNVINGKEQNRSSGTYGAEVVRTLKTADLSLKESGKFITIERS